MRAFEAFKVEADELKFRLKVCIDPIFVLSFNFRTHSNSSLKKNMKIGKLPTFLESLPTLEKALFFPLVW